MPIRNSESLSPSPNCPQNLSQRKHPHCGAGSSQLEYAGGGGGTKTKAKTNQKKPRNSSYAKTSVTGRVSAVAPCRQSSELPSQNVREESNFGDCPRVSADSFVTGMATCSLFNSRRKAEDTVGTVLVEAAPLATAAVPRASRLLLEHVDGVLVLHLQLRRGVCFINRLPVKPESNLSH